MVRRFLVLFILIFTFGPSYSFKSDTLHSGLNARGDIENTLDNYYKLVSKYNKVQKFDSLGYYALCYIDSRPEHWPYTHRDNSLYRYLVRYYFAIDDLEACIETCNHCLEISRALDNADINTVLSCLLNKGLCLQNSNDRISAISIFHEALNIAIEHDVLRKVEYSYAALANLHKVSDVETGIEYALKSIEVGLSLGDQKTSYPYSLLSEIHFQQGEMSEAKQYLEQAIEINQKKGIFYVKNHIQLASILALTGDIDRAEKMSHSLLERDLSISERLECLRLLVNISTEKMDKSSGRNYLEELVSLTNQKKIENVSSRFNSYTIARRGAQALGFKEMEIEVLDSLFALRGILDEEKRQRALVDVEIKYQTKEKEDRISYQERELNRGRTIIIGVSFFSVLLAFLLYMLWKNNQKINQQNKIIQDTNERLQINVKKLTETKEELVKSNAHLAFILKRREQLIERLKRFAVILAHDFKQPLKTITSFGNLLNSAIDDKLNESESEQLSFIIRGSNRLYEMVDRLYEYSNNTLVLLDEFSTLEVEKIIDQVIEDLHFSISKSQAEIILDPIPYHIIANETLMYQLFQNLISNAIKYRKTDVPLVIQISNKIVGKKLEIQVKDNGIGIDKDSNPDLFELFSRGNATSKKEGVGLGLSTCKEVMNMHGGDIDYESELGMGTTFILLFTDFVGVENV